MLVEVRCGYDAKATLGRERKPRRRGLYASTTVEVVEVGDCEAPPCLDVTDQLGVRRVYRHLNGTTYAPCAVPEGAGHRDWLGSVCGAVPLWRETPSSKGVPALHDGTTGLRLAAKASAAEARKTAVSRAGGKYILVDGKAWMAVPEPRLGITVDIHAHAVRVVHLNDGYLRPNEVSYARMSDVPRLAALMSEGRDLALQVVEVAFVDRNAFRLPADARALAEPIQQYLGHVAERMIHRSRARVMEFLDLRDAVAACARLVPAADDDERRAGEAVLLAYERMAERLPPSRAIRDAMETAAARWDMAKARWVAERLALDRGDETDEIELARGFG